VAERKQHVHALCSDLAKIYRVPRPSIVNWTADAGIEARRPHPASSAPA
jgi:hypothetical protein